MKTLMMMLILAGGISASAQTGTTSTTTSTTTTTTGPAMTANDTPAAACRSMVENAKNKNFDAFMKMTTDMPPQMKQNKKAAKNDYAKMQSHYMDRLQDLSCGNEIIAQDHAVVESESKDEKRLVPFVKSAEGWKFDMKTYQSFYHTTEGSHGKHKM